MLSSGDIAFHSIWKSIKGQSQQQPFKIKKKVFEDILL